MTTKSPNLDCRMAAEEIPTLWWWNLGIIAMKLKVIWGMSDKHGFCRCLGLVKRRLVQNTNQGGCHENR